MAVVEVVLPGVAFYSPFERPPDDQALWTPIPRGLRGFTVHNGVVTAKPVNDSLTLNVTGTLPTQYAYVLADYGFRVTGAGAGVWDDKFNFHIGNFFQGQDILANMAWVNDFVGIPGQAERAMGMQSRDMLFSGPMWSAPGLTGISWFFAAKNGDATVQGTGTCNAYCTFYEFDREQIRKFPLNTPIPTRSR